MSIKEFMPVKFGFSKIGWSTTHDGKTGYRDFWGVTTNVAKALHSQLFEVCRYFRGIVV
jgi:hypothetical protein